MGTFCFTPDDKVRMDMYKEIEKSIDLTKVIKKDTQKTLLCCIGRLENKYIREFVEFYKKIGVTNICLYDNNRDGEDDFHDVIGDYIDDGFVILKDYRNLSYPVQLKAYTECYFEYRNRYDWFLFFDIDEFLFLKKDKDLSSWLSNDMFRNFNTIHVNWKLYGDGGNVRYEEKPILERITSPIPIDSKTSYDCPDNNHVKSIVRGGLDLKGWVTMHAPIVDGKCCNASGRECDKKLSLTPYDYKFAELRHYTTKTAEEYAYKIKRGFCDGNKMSKETFIDLFFKRNKFTQEKLDLINSILDS